MADCAVCYRVDPKFDEESSPKNEKRSLLGLFAKKKETGERVRKFIFTDEYFVNMKVVAKINEELFGMLPLFDG